MRVLVVAAVLTVGLAGCSSAPPEPKEDQATGTVFTSTATLSNLPPPVPMSDTMYLLGAPHMAATLPGPEVSRTPVPSLFDFYTSGGAEKSWVEWTFPRDGLAILEGNVTLWVEVQGAVTNPNMDFPGASSPCFWSIQLIAYQSDGGSASVGTCEGDEPNVVPPGVRQLRWNVSAFDISGIEGDTLAIAVGHSGIASDGATVELLGGTA